MRRYLCIVILLFSGCLQNDLKDQAHKNADELLEKIAVGTAVKPFPVKNFPLEQTESLLYNLQDNCEFGNRKGGYVDHIYQKRLGEADIVSFVYDFELSCDDVRFVLTYKLHSKDSIELYEFALEAI